jgi:glycosyltransferase involved in cell wall biosynthesis
LTERGDRELALKHGQQIISEGVEVCRYDRVLQGVRARNRVALRRERVQREGRDRWEGKRLLFIMPITEPGGGGHVILQEARSMQRMGVDVRILNLEENRRIFEASHPGLQIPVLYVQKGRFVPEQMTQYDAVIGTVYHTINWLQVGEASESPPIRAYYIQDFEPSFFNSGSRAHREAWESYARFPDLIRVTKTEWNRRIIQDEIGVDSTVIGPSVDIDLYRPRRRRDPDWPERPLRIAAMVRPSTPRRQPGWTMEILREVHRRRRGTVEMFLFGCHPEGPEFRMLPTDFPWRHAGILTQAQLAKLLNEVDILVDFSSSQAMGLTALNAMACGVAVIVPEQGGSMTFARHNENAIVVDTSSKEKCLAGLEQLVDDEPLRTRVQRKAIFDVSEYAPEFAAYNFLEALFP